MRECLWDECSNQTSNPKFCSLSCGTKYQMRHNKPFEKVVVTKVCEECGKEISLTGKEKVKRFCDRKCSAAFNNRKRAGTRYSDCLNCSAKIAGRGRKYCSTSCAAEHRRKALIDSWISGEWDGSSTSGLSTAVRRHLIAQANYRCQSPDCDIPGGWSRVNPVTGKVPLEVDHIDGNCYNNSPDNLIVLCPNCHSLTPTFRALNKNSGRTYRGLQNYN